MNIRKHNYVLCDLLLYTVYGYNFILLYTVLIPLMYHQLPNFIRSDTKSRGAQASPLLHALWGTRSAHHMVVLSAHVSACSMSAALLAALFIVNVCLHHRSLRLGNHLHVCSRVFPQHFNILLAWSKALPHD